VLFGIFALAIFASDRSKQSMCPYTLRQKSTRSLILIKFSLPIVSGPAQLSGARIFEVHRSDLVIHRRFIYGEGIMPQTQRSQVQPVKLRCRFEMTAADAPSSHEFCVLEFPGCEGCPKAQHTVRTVGSSEDPMKSEALRAWVAGAPAPKKSFSL
jgi:hypothetical protein